MLLLKRLLIVLMFAFPLYACDTEEGPMEEMGENVDETVDETQEELGDAADETRDELDEAGDELADETN